MWVTNFNRIVRVVITKKGTFDQILEEGKRTSHLDIAHNTLQPNGMVRAKKQR